MGEFLILEFISAAATPHIHSTSTDVFRNGKEQMVLAFNFILYSLYIRSYTSCCVIIFQLKKPT